MKYRLLYLEAHYDIDDLLERLHAIPNAEVALVVPRGAVLLQSQVALKIVQRHADDLDKEIALITKDRQARQWADDLNIPAAAELDELERPMTSPLGGQDVAVMTRAKNFTKKLREKEHDPAWEEKKQRLLNAITTPNKLLLGFLVMISVTLVIFVATIALPGATITITPQKKPLTTTVNITLQPEVKDHAVDAWFRQIAQGFAIESVFNHSTTFDTVTREFVGTYAQGVITIVSQSEEDMTFKPNTVFATPGEGIQFAADDWFRIPPFGAVNVPVTALASDTLGYDIGERGNIPKDTLLTIPALTQDITSLLTFSAAEDFTGGAGVSVPRVTERDFELAEQHVVATILEHAPSDLERFLVRKNQLEDRDLVLLPHDQILNTEVLSITLPEELLGSEVAQFPVTLELRVSSIAFSHSDVEEILEFALEKVVNPGMELTAVQTERLYPEVISQRDGTAKISLEAQGVEAYVVEPKTVAGVEFVRLIKNKTRGQSVTEAEKILYNIPQIAAVDIAIWPPFLRSIPRLPENIVIELAEE